MSKLEVRISEAKRLYEASSERAFKASRAYNVLEAKINELREEWLGLCEILRVPKTYGHLTRLILLKQRVRAEYFRVRLVRRKLKARKHELLIASDMKLKRCLKDKEEKSCAKV